jgi:hypothetical protein
MVKVLRVKAVEGKMVHDLESMQDGVLAFVGRGAHVPFAPPDGTTVRYGKNVKVSDAKGKARSVFIPTNLTLVHGDAGTWPVVDDVVELPAVRDGDLIPADRDTAHACGLKFVDTIKIEPEVQA